MSRTMLLSLLFLTLTQVACNSTRKTAGESPPLVTGTIIDQSGLGTCSWLVELPDGSRIEPVNWEDFTFELVAGKKVRLTYEEVPDAMGGCMAGPIVRILQLKET